MEDEGSGSIAVLPRLAYYVRTLVGRRARDEPSVMNRKAVRADVPVCGTGTSEHRQVSREIVASRWSLRGIFLPLLFLFFAFGLTVYAFVIRETARSIPRDVTRSESASPPLQASSGLSTSRKFSWGWALRRPRMCYRVRGLQHWLYRLKLEPIARFRVDVQSQNGTVNYIGVSLMQGTRVFPTSPSAGITDEYQRLPERLLRFSQPPYWFPTPVGKPYLSVALTDQASAVQREHAYAYSLICLIKPGRGCDLPCDYLPLAWCDWHAELEKQGFGAGGFGPYYPSPDRCNEPP